jgi:hypothetical protein
MERQMKKMLALAAVVAGLGVTGPLAHAQSYIVNGHTASPAEVQRLVSYGAEPGLWLVDGYGISSVTSDQEGQRAADNTGPKCWYVLDVKLCE